ncbi:phosphatase PAP2 family protein [Gemmatimonadota bacterium]
MNRADKMALERPSPADYARRVLAIVGVIVLHLVVYYTVTRVNSNRPPAALNDPSIPLDDKIPLLGWTWVFYWAAYPYLTLGAALIVAAMREVDYKRAIQAFIVITFVGGAIQLLYPVAAPWTSEAHAMQTRMHESAFTRPYACLPSMHVAYSVITGFMGAMIARSVGLRWFHMLLAAGIAVSTLTLKEHYVADAVAGILLGLGGGLWWWRGAVVRTGKEAISAA